MRVLAGNSARNLAWHNVSDTAIERVSRRSDGGKIDLMGTSNELFLCRPAIHSTLTLFLRGQATA